MPSTRTIQPEHLEPSEEISWELQEFLNQQEKRDRLWHCAPQLADPVDWDSLRPRTGPQLRLSSWYDLPYPTRYHLLIWLLAHNEASCCDYVQKYIEEKGMKTRAQRQSFRVEKWSSPDDLMSVQWEDVDRVEMRRYADLFENYCVSLPQPGPRHDNLVGITGSMAKMRIDTVHREQIDLSHLAGFMRVPEMLHDWKRAQVVEQIFSAVLGERHVGNDERKEIDTLLFHPESQPCQRVAQSLKRIQTLCDETSYRYALSEDREFMAQSGWTCAENVELNIWDDVWRIVHRWTYKAHGEYYRYEGGVCIHGHQNLRAECLETLRQLRNNVAHKLKTNPSKLRKYTQCSILYAILLNDPERAIEIEIAAEECWEQHSRQQVLSRLRNYYQSMDIPYDQQ